LKESARSAPSPGAARLRATKRDPGAVLFAEKAPGISNGKGKFPMEVFKNEMLEGQIESLRHLIDHLEWSLIDQLYDLQHTLDDLDERLAVKD
jgi:hypothetical protein